MKKTYSSKDAKFRLKQDKLFEVVSELYGYIKDQEAQQKRHTVAVLYGEKRKLGILTESYEKPYVCSGFMLAELSFSRGNLNFRIYAHPNVVINPDELYNIGNRYKKCGY